MHLADHIRPLLRDHDCVIIPDFGGLVADVSPARAQPGRQALSPPTKLVAFNQALTRNDGLLVDALSQHAGLPIAQARELVRTAVANLQQELDATNRTELPGIGIFRRASGRGLAFEYTGTDNLLASAFGLPELAARPVRAGEARAQRPQPVLRGANTRRARWARLLPGGLVAVAVGLLLLVNYQGMQNVGHLPVSWQKLPKLAWSSQRAASPAVVTEPQLATLGQHDFTDNSRPTEGITPLAATTSTPVAEPTLQAAKPALSAANAIPASEAAEGGIGKSILSTTVPAESAANIAGAGKNPAPVVPTGAVATLARGSAPAASVIKSTTIKSRTGRFYVIAGAYSSLANAEKGRRTLLRAGHPARVILPYPGSRWFRLTAAEYPDRASAEREAQRLRASTHSDYITLKF